MRAVVLAMVCAACAQPSEVGGASSGGGSGGALELDGGDSGAFAHCALESHLAEPLPLSLFIMLDQSASMADAIPGGSKWKRVTEALGFFVEQPDAAGIGVGLGYFGVPSSAVTTKCTVDSDCGALGPCWFGKCSGALGGDSCSSSDYEKPDVGITLLPGAKTSIIDSLAAHGPSSETPTLPALTGAVTYARTFGLAHPEQLVAVVLATDGEPSTCDTDIAAIAQVAAEAYLETPSIRTFVIGVGASLNPLNRIAYAGQTGKVVAAPPCSTEPSACGLLVDDGASAGEAFLAAMNQIRSALGCRFAIPAPNNGELDLGKVNVQLGGGVVGYTASASGCDPLSGGWHYDAKDDPENIVLCPSTCEKAQAPGSRIDVILGCTIVLE